MADPSPPSRPVAGILWMLTTGVLFVAVTAIVKHVGDRIPAPEMAFLRYALGLIFLIPMIRPMLAEGMNRSSLKLFGIRGVAHAIGVMFWFFAMTQIPIAEVTSMGYLSPRKIAAAMVTRTGER